MPLILQIYIYIQVIRLIFHMVIWISIFCLDLNVLLVECSEFIECQCLTRFLMSKNIFLILNYKSIWLERSPKFVAFDIDELLIWSRFI